MIYQTSEGSEAIRKEEYLYYLFCMYVMPDGNVSPEAKLDALKQFRDQISARHGNSAGCLQGITIGENAKGTVQRNLTINCRNGIVISKNNEGNICYNITAGELSAEQIKEAAQYLSSAPRFESTK